MTTIPQKQYQMIFRNLKYSLALVSVGIFLSAVCVNHAGAQNLDFDEVKVIAPYEPTISDAFKINFNPRIEDTLKVNIVFDYNINPLPVAVNYKLEPLTPARMRGEPLAKIYKGYAKAGLGNYTTPYGELFYNTLRSNEYQYGVHVKHMSSAGKINNYGYSGYSDNNVELFGKRFFSNHTLHAGVAYDRNMVHFYGFRPEEFDQSLIDTLSRKDYRQIFNFVSPEVEFRSNYLDSLKLQHSFRLKYYYFDDNYDASEQHVDFEGTLQKTLREDPMGFAQKQTFRIDMGADYFKNQHLADTAHTALFTVAPTLSAKFKDFDFYVGVRASFQSDTASFARFYPLAGAQVTLIKDVLFAYASLSGELSKNNMYDLTRKNPFMLTSVPYAFMNKKSEIRGGFKGSLSSFAAYNISISNSNIDNYAFFATDTVTLLSNQFMLVYDDIRLFNFRAEVFSNIGERLRLRFSSDYYQYSLENEAQPWHEPTLKLGLNVRYNIQDKIILNSDVNARNSIYARLPLAEPDPVSLLPYSVYEIPGFHVDVSFGIEYRYTKILSVFLNLNNVQNQALERWYNYPSQRFNVLGGVTYAF